MPSKIQNRLAELMAEGMTVYPANMRGLAAPPPRRGQRRFVPPAVAKSHMLWLKSQHPKLYAAAQRRIGQGSGATFSGLGATIADKEAAKAIATTTADKPGLFERFAQTITSLAPQYLQYRAQQDLLDVQLDRARQGLPPLRPQDYAPAVQLSVDPSMYSPALESIKPWLLPIGLGVVGLVLFKTFAGGRRGR